MNDDWYFRTFEASHNQLKQIKKSVDHYFDLAALAMDAVKRFDYTNTVKVPASTEASS